MSIVRRDDTVMNTLGNAIAGANVYVLLQPANVSNLTPLAPIYSDTGGTAASNPQITDGFGHAVEYLNDGQLYTIVYIYPNGMQVVYPDQFVGVAQGAPQTFSGLPSGAIDGSNRTFVILNGSTPLTAIPTQATVWLNFPLIQGLGYVITMIGGQACITFANPPQPGDSLWAQGLL